MRAITWMRWTMMVGLLVGAGVLISASPGRAQEAAEPAPAQRSDDGGGGVASRAFDHFVTRGGWITWFTLIPLSVVAMALAIEHAVTIRRKTIIPPESVEQLKALLDQRNYTEAVRFSSEDPTVVSYVTHAGLVEAIHGYAAMERALEEAVEERTARLMRKIEYLNVIGNVAPMLGLFGTIYGMIGMFVSISESGGIPVAARVAEDLGVALITTFWGLLIAIPSLSVFALFRNRIDLLMAECATAADRLLGVFKPQLSDPARAAGAPAADVAELAFAR